MSNGKDNKDKKSVWSVIKCIILFPFIVPFKIWKKFKENFLDYMFSKIEYDEKGICGIKTCGYPIESVAGHFLVTVPLVLAAIQHFFPSTNNACACITLLLFLLSWIIVRFDFSSLALTSTFWIGLLIGGLVDLGFFFVTQNYLGEGYEILTLINKAILSINPVINTGTMIMISLISLIVILLFTVFHVLQNRIYIKRDVATLHYFGGTKDIPTTFGTITMKVNSEESIFAGVGNLAFRNISDQNKVDLLVEHVQGLGNGISVLLCCPWARKVKGAIVDLNSDRTKIDN